MSCLRERLNRARRAIASVLAFAMVISLMPGFGIQSLAAANDREGKTKVVVNLSQGLTAGMDYDGISVLENHTVKNAKPAPASPSNASSSNADQSAVHGSTNAAKNGVTLETAGIPESGAVVVVKPEGDGEFQESINLGKGKTFYVVRDDGAEGEEIYRHTNETGAEEYLEASCRVEKGETYYAYVGKSKPNIFWLALYYDEPVVPDKPANEAETVKIDLSSGLKKGENYRGVSVLEDMNKKSQKVTIEGTNYTYYVAGTNNPKIDNSTNMNGTTAIVPNTGAAVVIHPERSGSVTIDISQGNTKTWYFVKESADGAVVIDSYKNETGANELLRYTYPISENATYYAYVAGSKVSIFGITLEYTGEEPKELTTWRFDFGISASETAEGWIPVTLNKKGGKKTTEELGIAYSEEKGYGFLETDLVIEGRNAQGVEQRGIYPKEVYTDFGLLSMKGKYSSTFAADVENGTYGVRVICGANDAGIATYLIEGQEYTLNYPSGGYEVGYYEVTVEDGQMEFEFLDGDYARVTAITMMSVADAEKEKAEEDKILGEIVDIDDPNFQPKYNPSEGSSDVTGLMVPTLAYDDTSIVLVWQKPEKYAHVADYHVYINGELQPDTARENYKVYADWNAVYMEEFYKTYGDEMVNVDIHSYTAANLQPDTEYTFEVRAIDEAGNELGTSNIITQSTTAAPEIFDIRDFGAEPIEKGMVTYNEEDNAFIVKNTKAIQAAIDACTEGGKVVVPAGIWMSGALWLKSDMTFELQEGAILWSSPNSDHFDVGFLMYPFYTDTRCWGILNATSSEEGTPLKNIRITGKGTVYGNGWKYGSGATVHGDGYERYTYRLSADPKLEGYELPRWVNGGNSKVFYQGILAADSAKKYLANCTNADGSPKYPNLTESDYQSQANMEKKVAKKDLTDAYATRSSLIIMRNIEGVYIGDITVENPANHSVNILDSRDIAANNVKVLSYDCNNGDGLGFGCSQNVVCFNNFLDTGDDTIGFGASVGKGAQDSEIQSNSNIWIFDNYVHEGHGGIIACGSHTAQGVFNMLAEDNIANHSDMPFRFKSAPTNGGYASNVLIRDSAIADCNQAFVFTTSYSDPNSASSSEAADVPAEFYDIDVYNVTAKTIVQNTICVYADVDPVNAPQKPWHAHHNLYFQDVTFSDVGTNGSYKYYNGWGTLTGCEDSVFYNVKVDSYSSKAKNKVAWGNILYSSGNKFLGTTEKNDLTNNQMSAPAWKTDVNLQAASSVKDGEGYQYAEAALNWAEAEDNGRQLLYSVEVYRDGAVVDKIAGIKTNSCTVSGLSTATEYTFKVYASDPTGNETFGAETALTTEGNKDTAEIVAPSSKAVTLSDAYYRHAQAKWQSARKTDKRVRGYEIYVNGDLAKTVYNNQIANGITTDTISLQIGRMEYGTNNKISIVAFTDAGIRMAYAEGSIQTLEHYDYKAPVWPSTQLTAVKNEDGSLTLSWNPAEDDSSVWAYRVYVDGIGVYTTEGDYFKPTNGTYTTKDTTFTLTAEQVDFAVPHVIQVQAGDQWWKSAQTMGTYDKLADYHWTLSGPSYEYTPEEPVVVDKTALTAAVEEAEAKAEADYTEESWSAFAAALQSAKEVAAKEDAAQEEVDAAAETLKAAMQNLVKKPEPPVDPEEPADKGQLEEAVSQAEALKAEEYTQESWKAVADALITAKDVIADADATQEEIDAALAALRAAENALVKKPAINIGSNDDDDNVDVEPHAPQSAGQNSNAEDTGVWNMAGDRWTYTEQGALIRGRWAELEWKGSKDWYYFDEDGFMVTGWLVWNGRKYFLHPVADGTRGKMYTGWQLIDGKWYYFNTVSDGTKGALFTNTETPDGYHVDADGIWVETE